ncbi:MAG: hypothetical protein KAG20_03310 [Cocleimonas sp.]|nr:hypothetical protein [Cocleimonas sp.]
MKKNIIATAALLSLTLTGCGGTDNATASPKKIGYNDLFLTISISDGMLKGTHTFSKIKDSFMSFVSMEYSDATNKSPQHRDIGKFNSNNLISEDGKLTLMFLNKRFKGNITKGTHEGAWLTEKDGSQKCGDFMIADTGKQYDFERMYSNNLSCNTVTLSGFSEYKEGTIYNRRTVAGSFNDRYELKFEDHDGKLVEKVSVEMKVSFGARQQTLKTAQAN